MPRSGSNSRLQDIQTEILEAIACGEPLHAVANRLCMRVEELAPDVICSILTLDVNGCIHPLGGGKRLPEAYSRSLEGARIGVQAGSCGTAAWRGEPVQTLDIATDPLWVDYRTLALLHGLKACWSSPIKARDGRVLGTFAFYYTSGRGPTELEREIVEKCVHICVIAIEHERTRERIRQLAFHDSLTGLPNRARFRERGAEILAAIRAPQSFHALYIDLEDFKGVNDTLGHRAGDRLLESVARRIVGCLPDDAFVAHLGGDEFAVVLVGTHGRPDASALARKILVALSEPFRIDERKVTIGASIGIAGTVAGDLDLPEISKRADMALYTAKREGHRTFRFFEPEMEIQIQSRRRLRQDLRAALAAHEIELAFQPLVALDSGEVRSVEALARWLHSRQGDISPEQFIPVAEETGMIGELGAWVLDEACRVATAWPPSVRVAVNLSPLQIKERDIVADIVAALRNSGLPADRLDLEVTESVLLVDDSPTRATLLRLRAMGIRVALDDFGTGYSSLRALRAFPFDKIKIDMSFVRDIGKNTDSTAIIRAIIGLARDLGMTTAAEGIETQTQWTWLAEQDCDEGQGFYISEPLTAAQIQTFLAECVSPSTHFQPMFDAAGHPHSHHAR